MSNEEIRFGIIGIGNCCSSLIQGLNYYTDPDIGANVRPNLMYEKIGPYTLSSLKPVMAIDVDKRKIGKPLNKAIFSPPNCSRVFHPATIRIEGSPIVVPGPSLDGVSSHMASQEEHRKFDVAEVCDEFSENWDVGRPMYLELLQNIKDSGVELLVNYLPVGSQIATEYYANLALDAGVGFLNCIPVFIASDREWARKFYDKGLPVLGDDIKSMFGASILSQVLQEAALDRGHDVLSHTQINIGGNSDFNNMTVQERLASKKKSKENVIKSQNDLRMINYSDDQYHAGPSTYVPSLKDNKVAYISMEMEGFGGAPVTIDAKLSVQDSENSAGVVVDAIRFLALAKREGVAGSLDAPSSWLMKSPPVGLPLSAAKKKCDQIALKKEI